MTDKPKFSKRELTMGMLFSLLLMNSILGAISGLVWAFALSLSMYNGSISGGIIGLVFGFLLFIFNKAAMAPGNLQGKEVQYTSGSITGFLLLVSTVLAIGTGLVRWMFF